MTTSTTWTTRSPWRSWPAPSTSSGAGGGPAPRSSVALFAGNHPDFLAAYLGPHLAGGVLVPINTRYRRVELGHILGDVGVGLCVTDPELVAEIDNVRGDLPDLRRVVGLGADFENFLRSASGTGTRVPAGEDLAMVAYTLGTTGRSKGAMLSLIAGAVLGGGARHRVPGLFIRRSFAGFVVFTAARIVLDAATGT